MAFGFQHWRNGMTLFEIIMIGIGLSLDVYAYCLYKGAMMPRLDRGNILKCMGLFTGFQMGAMILGSLVRLIPAIRVNHGRAEATWIILSACLFLGLGIYMIIKAVRRWGVQVQERREDDFNYHQIFFWCVLTSIDSFIAGIGFGFLSVNFIEMLLTVGIATAVCVTAGIISGYRVGCYSRNVFLTLGGCIVAAGGVDLIIRALV